MGDSRNTDVVAMLLAAAERAKDVGGAAASTIGGGVEDAVAALVARRVTKMMEQGGRVAAADVVDALDGPGDGVVSRIGKAGAGKLARRMAAARAITSRTPAGLALRYGPAVVSGLQADLRSVDAAAGFVVSRARDAGVEPDPGRVESVVVQALAGHAVDPDAPADHTALVRVWMKDLGTTVSPLPSSAARARRAATIVAALSSVDARDLA